MQSVTVLRITSRDWTEYTSRVDHILQDLEAPSYRYLLVEKDVFSHGNQLTPVISRYFRIPDHLFSDTYRRSNGFFSTESSYDNDGHLQLHNTRFRFLIKFVNPSRITGLSYTWHEMTFFSRWSPDRCSVLCVGMPHTFIVLLQENLSRLQPKMPSSNPYSLHIPLIESIIAMHDSSVWFVRDVVRSVERDRSLPAHKGSDFVMLHETARHAIHSSETLSVSVETLEAMRQQHLDFMTKKIRNEVGSTDDSIQAHMDNQIGMLRNLLHRSLSNKERLHNEISLAFNIIAQRDSNVMMRLGEAARLDNATMRTIAAVTMALLPPTLLSAIFSTSFFSYTPKQGSQPGRWSVSESFWIYWVLAVPLTCLTIGMLVWWQKSFVKASL